MQPFVVKLSELASGFSQLDWKIGREFFEIFENQEILDASLQVSVELYNHGTTVDTACEIEGSVTVLCDRCLEHLQIPVETSFEETYAPMGGELDMRQDVYDFICISLPIQRVHEEGKCDEGTTKFLSKNI